jgi:hypothetical protein
VDSMTFTMEDTYDVTDVGAADVYACDCRPFDLGNAALDTHVA